MFVKTALGNQAAGENRDDREAVRQKKKRTFDGVSRSSRDEDDQERRGKPRRFALAAAAGCRGSA